MRVGLVGYGRAGRAVADVLAGADDVDLVWIAKRDMEEAAPAAAPAPICQVGRLYSGELLDELPVDAVVDFSSAGAVLDYGEAVASRAVTIVSAISSYPTTTLERLAAWSARSVIMSSPNITLGINYLLVASQLLQSLAPYTDIEVIEEHFRDKPERSGTAVRIAEVLGLDDSKINSIRVGGIVGHHEVVFGFPYQTVRLVHESISREAFGTGTLFALRQLRQRPPGLYSYEDLLRQAMLEVLRGS